MTIKSVSGRSGIGGSERSSGALPQFAGYAAELLVLRGIPQTMALPPHRQKLGIRENHALESAARSAAITRFPAQRFDPIVDGVLVALRRGVKLRRCLHELSPSYKPSNHDFPRSPVGTRRPDQSSNGNSKPSLWRGDTMVILLRYCLLVL